MSNTESIAEAVDARIVQDSAAMPTMLQSPRAQILGDPVGLFILLLLTIAFLPLWANFFSSNEKPKSKQNKGKSNGKPRTITIQLGDTDHSGD